MDGVGRVARRLSTTGMISSEFSVVPLEWSCFRARMTVLRYFLELAPEADFHPTHRINRHK
jgi:hypothetical protein